MKRVAIALLLVIAGGVTGGLLVAAHAAHALTVAHTKADYYLLVANRMAHQVEQCEFAKRERKWP